MCAALETWCHQLLYVRRVYPSNTFCDSYFLGIRYKANRHPGVVEYISNAIQVAVPALMERVADEFCLEVINEKTEEEANAGDEEDAVEKKSNSSLLSAEFGSSPSDSQERAAKRLKSQRSSPQSPTNQIDLQPMTLFQNQQSQQSMSSLSSTNVQRRSLSQDSASSSKNTDNESRTNLQAPEKETSTLAYQSSQVLEKFSLYFSPTSDETTESEPKPPPPTNNPTKKLGPLFTKHKRNARANQGPSPEQLQQQAILAELERGFRHLILNVSNLNRDRVVPCDTLSFQVVLHVQNRQKTCTALDKALEAASWYPASTETTERPHMPLYQVLVNDWDIQFHRQRRVEKREG